MIDDFLWTYQNVIHAVGINGILALSIYVVLAVGQLSLGQAGFMCIGAYTGTLLTLHTGLAFTWVLALSAVVPGLAAVVIGKPTLRLSGVYLTITTLGFGEVVRILMINWDFAGGAVGIAGIPERGGLRLIYAILALLLLGLWLLGKSRVGRAMEAIRDDDVAAGVMGIDVPRYRMAALVLSSMIAGLGGALAAHGALYISPAEYGFETAVAVLSYALLGGISLPWGPFVGSTVLTVLPEALRPFGDLRLMVNGLIIVFVVLFMPKGLIPWPLRRVG